jgi:phi LC3 family holin
MDLKARLRNKTFLVSLFGAVLLLCQQLGLKIFPENVSDIFNTILVILTILGVVIDPTTDGITDKKLTDKIE